MVPDNWGENAVSFLRHSFAAIPTAYLFSFSSTDRVLVAENRVVESSPCASHTHAASLGFFYAGGFFFLGRFVGVAVSTDI